MLLYKFRLPFGARAALSTQPNGANLPRHPSHWIAEGPIEIPTQGERRIGPSSADILGQVQSRGYFLWPAKPDDVAAQGREPARARRIRFRWRA